MLLLLPKSLMGLRCSSQIGILPVIQTQRWQSQSLNHRHEIVVSSHPLCDNECVRCQRLLNGMIWRSLVPSGRRDVLVAGFPPQARGELTVDISPNSQNTGLYRLFGRQFSDSKLLLTMDYGSVELGPYRTELSF